MRLPGQIRSLRASRSDAAAGTLPDVGPDPDRLVDLSRRRDELAARVAELQWDLGGMVYEMATRDRIRVDVIVRRAAELQDVDAELSEVERILRMEQTGSAGTCPNCSAPHSSGAVYCWQCGAPLLELVPTEEIAQPDGDTRALDALSDGGADELSRSAR
jgi:hypothetical protein